MTATYIDPITLDAFHACSTTGHPYYGLTTNPMTAVCLSTRSGDPA